MKTSLGNAVSPTAYYVAYARTFAGSRIPYSNAVAEFTDSERHFRQRMGERALLALKMLAPVVEMRYRAVTILLHEALACNVLVLAAGLLPRGVIETADPTVFVVETDLPGIIRLKRQVNTHLLNSQKRSNLFCVPADIHLNSQLAEAAGLLPSKDPLWVVCEGLFCYLKRDEQSQLLANLLPLFAKRGGGVIATDIANAPANPNIKIPEPLLAHLREIRLFLDNSQDIADNLFAGEAELNKFAARAGYSVSCRPLGSFVNEVVSAVALGCDKSFLEGLTMKMPVAVFSPR